jgi:hypothetical protein
MGRLFGTRECRLATRQIYDSTLAAGAFRLVVLCALEPASIAL